MKRIKLKRSETKLVDDYFSVYLFFNDKKSIHIFYYS